MKKLKRTGYHMRRTNFFIILLTTLFAGACGNKKGTEVAVEAATGRSITETVSASGKIQPEVDVKLSPEISGEITELNVKEGDQVKKGDLLMRIRPEIYESTVNQMAAALNQARSNTATAQARLSQYEAQLAGLESAFNRTRQLHEDKVISNAEYDQAVADYEAMKAQVTAAKQEVDAARFNAAAAQARMKEANQNLDRTIIYAPVDGTVSKLNVEIGETVLGTSQMTGTELMRISNLSSMEVLVEVNENDITRISVGDTADIEVDAFLGEEFTGVVTEIASSANNVGSATDQIANIDQVTNFNVKVRILPESYQHLMQSKSTDLPSPFRPGLSASVDIQTERVAGTVSVPIQAVTIRDESGRNRNTESRPGQEEEKTTEEQEAPPADSGEEKVREVVFIHNEAEGTVSMREVVTGIQDDQFIEVKSGLEEGEKVVVAPFLAISKTLRDGSSVRIVERSELFSGEE
ncbi:biotin/lipoyl-binding protein [Anseongella ginsenosidimutans]|nr:biotin/lipoyl-binding protein [Anseongella ginsenosidimutans]